MSTVFNDHLLTGDHASRPAANAVPQGTLYSCTDHGIIYKSDGVATWSDWATISGVVSIASAALEMLIGAKAHASHTHYANEANLPGLTSFVNGLLSGVDVSALEFLVGAKAHASHTHCANEANLPGITALIAASAGGAADSDQNILANQIFGA